MLIKETLERIRNNRIKSRALWEEIQMGGNYDGVHGIDYSRDYVTGGTSSCDLSDVLMKREKNREKLVREYVALVDELTSDLSVLFPLASKLALSRRIRFPCFPILSYYTQAKTTKQIARELKVTDCYIRRKKGEVVKALLDLAKEEAETEKKA